MKDLQLFDDEKKMTVKEVAEVLSVSERVVQLSAKKMFPERIENGKKTLFNEAQVTLIKKDLESHHNLEGTFEVSTDLEMMLMDKRVSEWKSAKIADLESQLKKVQPMIESFNALQRSDKNMSITQAAKHFDLHPKTEVFPYLRDCRYLTSKDIPTQAAIDAGYLAVREVKCNDGEFRPTACVLASQLETWRTRVIPQIEAWKERNK
jgi:phage antirepressor YoqD-like protein